MTDRHKTLLLSGGHKGTEAEFGRAAVRWGVPEITYSFAGHKMEWSRNVRVLSPSELAKGDVSMEIVSQHMGRNYTELEMVRRVIQSMYHIVVNSYQVFAVGWIQADKTVMGGTGWGVELAKFFNRPVSVFDQGHGQGAWFTWKDGAWAADTPQILARPFAATGTRRLSEAGRVAIQALFERSFGPVPERRLPRSKRSRRKPAAKKPRKKAGR